MTKCWIWIGACLLLACHVSQDVAKAHAEALPKVINPAAVSVFNADSAYSFVARQVAFGPRVPNTKAHSDCADYLKAKLECFGADVVVQEAELTAFNHSVLHAKNIIAQYNPSLPNRIMLCAHWDSRPFADRCIDSLRRNEPILGANDGASGVGVLLEIARNIQMQDLYVGIDIILFDAEDYGIPDHLDVPYVADTWCLGSQYWASHPHVPNYNADYGILLDMVGAPQATFYQEIYSLTYAKKIVKKVWKSADECGYGNYFVSARGGAITDDHVYVNNLREIPCIDIIQWDPDSESGLGTYWHTHNDTMERIDKNTLKAVGQTVLHVILND
jgi:Zn-dependent M28 family amino/carboxypeptidase